ncbi:MAG TPA: IS5 family transposase [Blastocatellia bacterium]|nr:IS5 family transposase [Blastocatellia bacterium]
MRGDDVRQVDMFSYISPEQRVPKDHPLRPIRKMVDEILVDLSPRLKKLYSKIGRPSIAPEKLLRALLLQILYSVRSERMLMEQLDYNLLFRWFVGLNMDDDIWDASTFCKNRDRLLKGDIAEAFFKQVLERARGHELLSNEHFTVDGTLVEAAAGLKSFKSKTNQDQEPPDDPGNPTVNFHGEKRSNQTHQSKTDPEALLSKKGKGKEAKLNYAGHLLIENRNGLAIDASVTQATGTAERDIGVEYARKIGGSRRVTMGADKAYDTQEFVEKVREANVTPHVAQNNRRKRSAIDGRTTRHVGYEISQKKRKRIEEIFGWLKTVGLLRKVRHRGVAKVRWIFKFAVAAYNLVRIRNLVAT